MSDLIEQLRAAGCVFAEEEAALIAARFADAADQEAAVANRCGGAPLEVVLGTTAFAGATVLVEPGVFVPRLRAEALVDVAADFGGGDPQRFAGTGSPAVTALDLGCGTGAIAAALCLRHPDWSVHASDVAPAAVQCATRNASRFGFTVHTSDWFGDLPIHLRGALDLVVAHLPYVPTDQLLFIPRDYRAVEPLIAVDGGPDGLDPWRQVAPECPSWLASGGSVLTQVAGHQAITALAVGEAAGLSTRAMEYDDSVVIAATANERG